MKQMRLNGMKYYNSMLKRKELTMKLSNDEM